MTGRPTARVPLCIVRGRGTPLPITWHISPHLIHTIPGNTKLQQWAVLARRPRPCLRTLTANNTWPSGCKQTKRELGFLLPQLRFILPVFFSLVGFFIFNHRGHSPTAVPSRTSHRDSEVPIPTCRAVAIDEGSGSLPSVARFSHCPFVRP